MDGFVQAVTQINNAVNGFIWGVPMLALLIATGVFMTVRTKFFQVRKAKHVGDETFFAIFKKKGVTKTNEKRAISQFQALSTALAATIGTGNIAGVATAITVGGPGAVFWMWLSAFFGMMTNYSENVLGIYYRRKNVKGEWSGGAMYYLRDGLDNKFGKFLAVLFSIFCVLASFGIGNMTQINSISSALYDSFNVPAMATGIVLAIIAGLVIVGGIKRIASVTEKLVPFMALAYIAGAIIIIVLNIQNVPGVFVSIFKGAFGFKAAAGGIVGAAIKQAITMGFKRGVFSNEAGLGSSVMVHSASNVKEPVVQGMWGIFEVFADTIVVCTLTALVILSSGVVKPLDITTEKLGVITIDEQTRLEMAIDEATAAAQSQGRTLSSEELANIKPKSLQKINLYDYPIQEVTYSEELEESLDDESQVMVALSEEGGILGILNTDTDVVISLDDKPYSETYGMQLDGVPFVSTAFSHGFGNFAGGFVSIAILLFAFSTVLGWSFYGTKACEFLFGTRATVVYKVIFVLFIVVGATMSLDLAWSIADTLNGLMAIPNLIGVLTLSGTVVAITRNYAKRKFSGDESIQPMLSIFPDIQAEQEAKLDIEED